MREPIATILATLFPPSTRVNSKLRRVHTMFGVFGLSILGLLIVGYLNALYRVQESTIYQVTFILIISGAMGNILDRLVDGVVTDFLYLHIVVIQYFKFPDSLTSTNIFSAL